MEPRKECASDFTVTSVQHYLALDHGTSVRAKLELLHIYPTCYWQAPL